MKLNLRTLGIVCSDHHAVAQGIDAAGYAFVIVRNPNRGTLVYEGAAYGFEELRFLVDTAGYTAFEFLDAKCSVVFTLQPMEFQLLAN